MLKQSCFFSRSTILLNLTLVHCLWKLEHRGYWKHRGQWEHRRLIIQYYRSFVTTSVTSGIDNSFIIFLCKQDNMPIIQELLFSIWLFEIIFGIHSLWYTKGIILFQWQWICSNWQALKMWLQRLWQSWYRLKHQFPCIKTMRAGVVTEAVFNTISKAIPWSRSICSLWY